ncbi:MAG: hypothetical protein NC048_09390 [Bacteroides sp.]|nr:hypothetical protein [Ruminococcus flavefaciens]MCM1555690.1 hypothetical protein [Bacteroides sp.]
MNDFDQDNDRRARLWALLATFLFAVVSVCALLWLGLYRTYPPPPEYGIEVNLGYSEVGSGQMQAFEPDASPVEVPDEPEQVQEEEEVVTAVSEEAPALPKPEKVKPKPEPQKDLPKPAVQEQPEKKVEQPKEPEINPMALYPGKRKGSETSAQGETGEPGDQGKPNGDVNAKGYTGSGGSGGISFSLNGRTLMSLVKPNYDSEEEGVVVVRIVVDRNGVVTEATAGLKGTTTMDGNLWKTAERAALQSKFVPKENAPDKQLGTITYRFVRGA